MRAIHFTCLTIFVGACGLKGSTEPTDPGSLSFGSKGLVIKNGLDKEGTLRVGNSVFFEVATANANTNYEVSLTNASNGEQLFWANALTGKQGKVTLQIPDLGEKNGGFNLDPNDGNQKLLFAVKRDEKTIAERDVALVPHAHFSIKEASPYVYSTDCAGGDTPRNAFVVGALPQGDELGLPFCMRGQGFPVGADKVCITVVKERSFTMGDPIPGPGDEGFIYASAPVELNRGEMPRVMIDWDADTSYVGGYSIVADVYCDGAFDYGIGHKDGVDGVLGAAGVTLQYATHWNEARINVGRLGAMFKEAQRLADAAAAAAEKAAAAAIGPAAQQIAAQAALHAQNARDRVTNIQTAYTQATDAFADTQIVNHTTISQGVEIGVAEIEQVEIETAEASNLAGEEVQKAAEQWIQGVIQRNKITNIAQGQNRYHYPNCYKEGDEIRAFSNTQYADEQGTNHRFGWKFVVCGPPDQVGWDALWANHTKWNDANTDNPWIDLSPYVSFNQTYSTACSTQYGCSNSSPVTIFVPEWKTIREHFNDPNLDLLTCYVVIHFSKSDEPEYRYNIGEDMLDAVCGEDNAAYPPANLDDINKSCGFVVAQECPAEIEEGVKIR